MTFVVFLRGVNVGGAKTFRPSEFAKSLKNLEVINIGAAGTFIVNGKTGEKSLRDEISRRLPFKADVMICTSKEIVELVRSEPFGKTPSSKDVTWYVSILSSAPKFHATLPIEAPAGKNWALRIFQIAGKFVLSLARKMGPGVTYPTDIFEKSFGVSVTTRNWNTIQSICKKLPQK
ncbi:MAG: DUF1697 domain-containing protein [Acidobacteria bacterium]|nr:DUF1697 domain-containing protein [Acidobacteriota bacterium]